jgi:hypothetical protein
MISTVMLIDWFVIDTLILIFLMISLWEMYLRGYLA